MRIALLADIHANLAALDAVLAHAERQGAEAAWQMGDIVGYGPEPEAVIARLRQIGARGVRGNHDAAAVKEATTGLFNPLAAGAMLWTRERLGPESIAYLRALPVVDRDETSTLVHGSLREPLWEYLSTYEAAYAHFERQETMLSLAGHTHIQLVVREVQSGLLVAENPVDGETVDISEERTCVNPGAVGQPRDGDPRAAYAIYDSRAGTVKFHRVDYAVERTQEAMAQVGLAEALIARLSAGR